MGTMIQTLRLSEADFRGDALRRLAARPPRQQRSPQPHAAGRDPRLPCRLSPRRRRHRRDRTPSARPRSPRPTTAWKASPTSSTTKARGSPSEACDARRRARRRPAALRRRRHRPDQPHAPRSRPTSTIPASATITFDDLVDAYGEAIARADRRRRRHHPARDDLRHAQRQGRRSSRSRRSSPRRASACR